MEVNPKKLLVTFSLAVLGVGGIGAYVYNKVPDQKPVVTSDVQAQKPATVISSEMPTVTVTLPKETESAAPVETSALVKMQSAIDAKNIDTVKQIIADKSVDMGKDGGALVHRAVSAGDGLVLEALLDAGADKNALDEEGYTPLMRAAELDDSNASLVMTVILKGRKADIHIKTESGHNAFVIAVMERNEASARILLDAGAKADEVFYNEHGFTPLMSAAKNGDAALLQAMIATKPDLDIKNNDGETALMLAVRDGHALSATILIRAGARLDIKNEKGETVLDIAEENETAEIFALRQLISEKSPLLNLPPKPAAKANAGPKF